jgi:hypothetical protein
MAKTCNSLAKEEWFYYTIDWLCQPLDHNILILHRDQYCIKVYIWICNWITTHVYFFALTKMVDFPDMFCFNRFNNGASVSNWSTAQILNKEGINRSSTPL